MSFAFLSVSPWTMHIHPVVFFFTISWTLWTLSTYLTSLGPHQRSTHRRCFSPALHPVTYSARRVSSWNGFLTHTRHFLLVRDAPTNQFYGFLRWSCRRCRWRWILLKSLSMDQGQRMVRGSPCCILFVCHFWWVVASDHWSNGIISVIFAEFSEWKKCQVYLREALLSTN